MKRILLLTLLLGTPNVWGKSFQHALDHAHSTLTASLETARAKTGDLQKELKSLHKQLKSDSTERERRNVAERIKALKSEHAADATIITIIERTEKQFGAVKKTLLPAELDQTIANYKTAIGELDKQIIPLHNKIGRLESQLAKHPPDANAQKELVQSRQSYQKLVIQRDVTESLRSILQNLRQSR